MYKVDGVGEPGGSPHPGSPPAVGRHGARVGVPMPASGLIAGGQVINTLFI
jgi:hypothetical protein